MINYLSILAQISHQPDDSNYTPLIMAILSITLLVLLAASGRVQLGFAIPGFPTPLYRSRKKILTQHFPYYRKLSPESKRKFEQRVQAFIMAKTFYGRNLQINETMRVLIAACAVQLTFGLPKVKLKHFNRIILYPNDYYSTINRTYHKGEINPKLKAIVLSWNHFIEGYIDRHDGINLGLHEMAHALHLENIIQNGEYDFLDSQALAKWNQLAPEEMTRVQEDENHLFRTYASVNEHEFFAIAVENFFERSSQFKDRLPQLYQLLTLILQQNPADRLSQI